MLHIEKPEPSQHRMLVVPKRSLFKSCEEVLEMVKQSRMYPRAPFIMSSMQYKEEEKECVFHFSNTPPAVSASVRAAGAVVATDG